MLITSTEQLAPEYLTDLLRAGGSLDRGKVVQIEVTLTKRLHASIVSRLEVTYSADAWESGPRKLFLKISLPDGEASTEQHGKSEVEFYNSLAHERPGPPFIKCFDAFFPTEARGYHLLLEDLSDTYFQPETRWVLGKPKTPSRAE